MSERRFYVVGIGLVLIALISVAGMGAFNDVDLDNPAETKWCAEHDGDLVQSNVIGQHGGLHCQLENGTLIHFHNMDFNESDN